MSSRILHVSRAGEVKTAGHHGNPVVTYFSQLHTLLRSRLSLRHARLLAEPLVVEGSGDIEWHTDVPGTITAAADCDAEARQRLQADFARLTADIDALRAQLAVGDASARNWAELLGRVFGGAASDTLFQVGDQPVLAEWGVERETAAATSTTLSRPGGGPTSPGAVRDGQGGAAGPGGGAAPGSGGTGRRRWWWLFLLLLLAAPMAALLRYCTPPAFCPVPPATAPTPTLEDRRETLRAERDQLRTELERRRRACAATATPTATPAATPSATSRATLTASATETSTMRATTSAPKAPATAAASPSTRVAEATVPGKSARCQGELRRDRKGKVVFVVDSSASMRLWYGISRAEEEGVLRSMGLLGVVAGREFICKRLDDLSGSRPRRMDVAKDAIRAVYPAMPDSIDIGLVEFGTVSPGAPDEGCGVRSYPFFPSFNRGAFWNRVRAIDPMGGTPIARGIDAGAQMLRNVGPGDAAAMIIVTDGMESCHGNACAQARAAKASIPNLQVMVIDLGGYPENQCIAQSTGGKLFQPSSSSELVATLKNATVESLRDPECHQ